MDESRQVDELLNYGNPTSRPRPLPPVEGDLEVMSRDDLDVGMDVGRVVLPFCEEHLREVEEPLFFETPSRGSFERSRRNSVINPGPRQGLVH